MGVLKYRGKGTRDYQKKGSLFPLVILAPSLGRTLYIKILSIACLHILRQVRVIGSSLLAVQFMPVFKT